MDGACCHGVRGGVRVAGGEALSVGGGGWEMGRDGIVQRWQ